MSSETSEWITESSPLKPVETYGSVILRAAVWGIMAVVAALALLVPLVGFTALGTVVVDTAGLTGDTVNITLTLFFGLGAVFDFGFIFYFLEH